jgi:predicted permease
MLPWIPVFLLVGWWARNHTSLPTAVPGWLSAWALRVALPATVLKVLAGLPLRSLWDPAVLLPWMLLPLLFVLPFIFHRIPSLSEAQRRLLLVLILLGNTSFLGLPLLKAVRGDAALHPALLYDQFGSFPQLLLLGTFLLESDAGSGGWRRVGWRLLRFPPLPALILALSPWGLLLKDLTLPLLQLLSWTLVPAVMLSLGARLRIRLSPEDRPALVWGLLGKMVLVPVLTVGLASLVGWRGSHAEVAVLESAMPPMATAAAWAADRGICPELAASLVSVGILLALVWIPLLSWLLDLGLLS